MLRKLLFLIFALGFCLTSLGRAANETIIWVSDSGDDSGFTGQLTAEGYIVDRHNGDLQGPLDQAELDLLNAARLVIVSRATGFMSESNVSDPMRKRMDTYSLVVGRLADEFDAVFVDVQAAFDRYLVHRPTRSLCEDRIHPNKTGHMIIAKAFLTGIEFDYRLAD